MKTKNRDFSKNGSLKNFILSSICLFLAQTKKPLGSGRYCLMYMATLVVARRGQGMPESIPWAALEGPKGPEVRVNIKKGNYI